MAPMVAQEAPLVLLQLMEGEGCINNQINLKASIRRRALPACRFSV